MKVNFIKGEKTKYVKDENSIFFSTSQDDNGRYPLMLNGINYNSGLNVQDFTYQEGLTEITSAEYKKYSNADIIRLSVDTYILCYKSSDDPNIDNIKFIGEDSYSRYTIILVDNGVNGSIEVIKTPTEIDTALSESSTNAVQNQAITKKLKDKLELSDLYPNALKITANSLTNKIVIPKDTYNYVIINEKIEPSDTTTIWFSDTTKLVFGPKGILKSNVKLILNNTHIIADPRQQIFTPDTIITGKFNTPFIYPEWWGAKGDGSTDDSAAINACLKAAGRSTVLMTAERYYVASSVILKETVSNINADSDEKAYINDGHYGMQVLLKGSLWGGPSASPVIDIDMSELTFKCDGAIVANKDANIAVQCNSERHTDIYINRIGKGRDYTNTIQKADQASTYGWFNGYAFKHLGGNSSRITINTIMGFKYAYYASSDYLTGGYCTWMSNIVTLGTVIAAYPVYVWLAPATINGTTVSSRANSFYNNNTLFLQSNSVGWNASAIANTLVKETNSTILTVVDDTGRRKINSDFRVLTADCALYRIVYMKGVGYCDLNIAGSFNDVSPVLPNGTAASNCINNVAPYSATNKFINIIDCHKIHIKSEQDLCYDWMYLTGNKEVFIDKLQNNWDLDSYYVRNYEKLYFDAIFKQLSLLIASGANTDNNVFKDQNQYCYIGEEINNFNPKVISSTSEATKDGLYIIQNNNSELWEVLERVSNINHYIGYTQRKIINKITTYNLSQVGGSNSFVLWNGKPIVDWGAITDTNIQSKMNSISENITNYNPSEFSIQMKLNGNGMSSNNNEQLCNVNSIFKTIKDDRPSNTIPIQYALIFNFELSAYASLTNANYYTLPSSLVIFKYTKNDTTNYAYVICGSTWAGDTILNNSIQQCFEICYNKFIK